jgi:hypothetical protein
MSIKSIKYILIKKPITQMKTNTQNKSIKSNQSISLQLYN